MDVHQIVGVLNDALAADPNAISALVRHRESCNRVLAEHPSFVVDTIDGGETFTVAVLSLLRAIAALDGDYRIAAIYDRETLLLTRFATFEGSELRWRAESELVSA